MVLRFTLCNFDADRTIPLHVEAAKGGVLDPDVIPARHQVTVPLNTPAGEIVKMVHQLFGQLWN